MLTAIPLRRKSLISSKLYLQSAIAVKPLSLQDRGLKRNLLHLTGVLTGLGARITVASRNTTISPLEMQMTRILYKNRPKMAWERS